MNIKNTIACGLLVAGAIIGSAIGIVGCADLNANTYNTEQLAVDTATESTHEFNQYYITATNGATEAQIAKLNSFRDEVYTADKDLSKALATLDAARLEYAANAAQTNQTAVTIAAATVAQSSSNVVALIKFFMNPTNAP